MIKTKLEIALSNKEKAILDEALTIISKLEKNSDNYYLKNAANETAKGLTEINNFVSFK